MPAIIISNQQMQFPFGAQTNSVTSRLISINANIGRLAEGIATASSGFTGTDGTQFETGNMDPKDNVPNLFGVQADPAHPGQQGQAYRYAMDNLTQAWTTFWEAARNYIEALDNGQMSM